MMFRKVSERRAVLGFTLAILTACGRDAPSVNEPAVADSKGPKALLTAADSAAAIAAAGEATTFAAATVTSITLNAGESIVVTVLSTECSGDPETVKVYGAISTVVASAPCGSLPGTQITLGPASTSGTISFRATHSFYGEGPNGQVTGSSPEFTVGMNDGYPGDTDFNDVVISVRISCPPANDRILDNVNFANRLDSAMKLSNLNAPLGSRKEAWFFAYQDSTVPGGIRFGFPTIIGSTECTSTIDAPLDPTIIAAIHTHPHFKKDNMELGCGVKGAKKYDPEANGGGSDKDWAYQRQFGIDVYAISPQMAHLLPRSSTAPLIPNPYKWKRTANACWL